MNYDLPLRFLARVWFMQPPRLATSKWINELSTRLATELDVGLLSDTSGKPIVALISRDTGWQVIVGLQSIDLELHGAPGRRLPPFPKFLSTAGEVLSIVANAANLPGHRAAAVAEGFLGAMAPTAAKDLAHRFLLFPNGFDADPQEWDWRCVQRIMRHFGGQSEITNLVTAIRRMQGEMTIGGATVPLDRIRVDCDFNTLHENEQPRFTPRVVGSFFTEAIVWYEQLLRELGPLLEPNRPTLDK